MSPPLLPQDITMTEETVLDLLGELVAIVRGECPSLLSEDSGGSAELSMRIDAALSRAPGAEDRLADEKHEVVAALYKAWPDAEDIPSDWPLGIIGCIEQIISERDEALSALSPPSTGGEGEAATRLAAYAARLSILADTAQKYDPSAAELEREVVRDITEVLAALPQRSEGGPVAWIVFAPNGAPHDIAWSADSVLQPGFTSSPLYFHPSPEMGEISRGEIAEAVHRGRFPADREPTPFADEDLGGREYCFRIADQILKLKENGLSREGLGGDQPAPVVRGQGPNPVLTDGPLSDGAPPEPPWPPGPSTNAKREGWVSFFVGRGRGDCPFPPARSDLQKAYVEGWDAAQSEGEG